MVGTCKYGPKYLWGSWEEFTDEEVSSEEVSKRAENNAVTVAVAEFEVVEKCPFECCVGLAGFKDKLCVPPKICSDNTCKIVKEECPFECCENEEKYFDKECPTLVLEGHDEIEQECIQNNCVATVVVQCNVDSDCAPPTCSGMSVSCLDNKCVYTGSCIEQPYTVDIWEEVMKIFMDFWSWIVSLFGW